MTNLRGAHHVGLHVQSIERSRSFFEEFLECTVIFEWNPQAPYIGVLTGHPNVDLRGCILRLPSTDVALELLEYQNVDLEPADPASAAPGTAHLAFFVNDVDALYANWTARGVLSVSEPVTPTIGPNEGGRVVYMLDPDGNRIELIQSRGTFTDFAARHQKTPEGCC
jgi:lactoylglutathione lyase